METSYTNETRRNYTVYSEKGIMSNFCFNNDLLNFSQIFPNVLLLNGQNKKIAKRVF